MIPSNEREQLIRQLEHRLAKLKSGASPAEIILNNREETAHEHKKREKVTLGPGAEVDLSGKGFSSLECMEDVGMKIILKGSEEEITGVLSAVAGEIAALVLAAQERQGVDPIEKLAGKVHDELKRLLEESRSRREFQ